MHNPPDDVGSMSNRCARTRLARAETGRTARFLDLRGSAGSDAPRAATRRPAALHEFALLVGVYVLYISVRLVASNDVGVAVKHATTVLRIEQLLDIDVEATLNTALTHVTGLEVVASYWYSAFHYIVTLVTLVLLYRLRPDAYSWARISLVGATLFALVGYLVFPTAPPRLTSGDYVDTLAATSKWGWWSDQASAPRGFGGATNQLAAMPSMHVGWALWCSIVLYGLSRYTWQRWLAVTYSVITALVVVMTGNHWVLDLVAGWAIMLAALAVTRSYVLRDMAHTAAAY